MKTKFESSVYGQKLLYNEIDGRCTTYESIALKHIYENKEYQCQINSPGLPSRAECRLP
jgi:hypothetical protein